MSLEFYFEREPCSDTITNLEKDCLFWFIQYTTSTFTNWFIMQPNDTPKGRKIYKEGKKIFRIFLTYLQDSFQYNVTLLQILAAGFALTTRKTSITFCVIATLPKKFGLTSSPLNRQAPFSASLFVLGSRLILNQGGPTLRTGRLSLPLLYGGSGNGEITDALKT